MKTLKLLLLNTLVTIALIAGYHFYYLPAHNYSYKIYVVNISDVLKNVQKDLGKAIIEGKLDQQQLHQYFNTIEAVLNQLYIMKKKMNPGKKIIFLLDQAVVRGDVEKIDLSPFLGLSSNNALNKKYGDK